MARFVRLSVAARNPNTLNLPELSREHKLTHARTRRVQIAGFPPGCFGSPWPPVCIDAGDNTEAPSLLCFNKVSVCWGSLGHGRVIG